MIGVVIPSRTLNNVAQCLDAIALHEDKAVPLVVDDEQSPAGDFAAANIAGHCLVRKVTTIPGIKPFVFARNVNRGIRALLDIPSIDGVVILNDDAILETPRGFTILADAAKRRPEYGIIAATTNHVGNLNQRPQGIGLREDPRMVCFVCVYIPRTTIEKVGLLDERFVGYGMDDDDYCLRVRNAGLRIGIHDGCFVDHGSLKSSYRGNPDKPADFSGNLEIFKQKWGTDNFGRAV